VGCGPGVGDDDVDVTKGSERPRYRVIQATLIPDVGFGDEGAGALGLDQLGREPEIRRSRRGVVRRRDRGRDVDCHDVRAFFGQPDGMRAALAPRRAGDERDLALQLSHRSCLALGRIR
jgi:hypothetical protein